MYVSYVIYLTIFSSSDLSLRLGLFLWICIASDSFHNCKPSLEVSILDIQQHTNKRKLSEAIHIHKNKPNLNDKSELENIVKYIT